MNLKEQMTDEELLLQTAKKMLTTVLPKVDPLKQEKLFLAVSLAKEQVEYAIHLLGLVKEDKITKLTIEANSFLVQHRKADLMTLNEIDGKMLAAEGRITTLENRHSDACECTECTG